MPLWGVAPRHLGSFWGPIVATPNLSFSPWVTLFGIRAFWLPGCPAHSQVPPLPEAQFRLSILERLEQLETRLGALPPPAPLPPSQGDPSETPPEQVRPPNT